VQELQKKGAAVLKAQENKEKITEFVSERLPNNIVHSTLQMMYKHTLLKRIKHLDS